MKSTQKNSSFLFDLQMRNDSWLNSISGGHYSTFTKPLTKFMLFLILFLSVTYVVYTLKVLISSRDCNNVLSNCHKGISSLVDDSKGGRTELEHIVFGIGASAKLWGERKNYIKLWWKPKLKMRGIVWLDSPVKVFENEAGLFPELRISGNTSKFAYENQKGSRSAIRISRIVSETLRLGMENVRWFVMGDDDTVFLTENLVRVLNKYDHNQFYYIGSSSESHLQNIQFSYGMAYGGGGFAISYSLAKALEKMQDRCIQNYPQLYGSDARIHACMAELGVPLTKEVGFHQYDVYGDLFGLLAAHPVAPFVSLHHLDVVEPIFPHMNRVEALRHLRIPMKLDSAALMQQSICYDSANKWRSWGFAVQLFRGVLSPREIEMPSRTFLNWYQTEDEKAIAFNTRPVMRNSCQMPYIFYLSRIGIVVSTNQTVSQYSRHRDHHDTCDWDMANPARIDTVEVYKKPDPHLWDRAPRRNCCRILHSDKKKMVVDVGICREGEISEIGNQ